MVRAVPRGGAVVRVTPWPKRVRVLEPGDLVEAFCSVCGLLVAHEPHRGVWIPVEHAAPECGGACVGGGVDRAVWHLSPTAHRAECERCSY